MDFSLCVYNYMCLHLFLSKICGKNQFVVNLTMLRHIVVMMQFYFDPSLMMKVINSII